MASQWGSVTDTASKVQAGELKATDLVERALKTIAEKDEYKAIIATLETSARSRAETIDAQAAKGQNVGRLA
jgi:Asp-tRNA(Asn)/Glu-tRNA(Gln) amidotransferase A subunit family amidase